MRSKLNLCLVAAGAVGSITCFTAPASALITGATATASSSIGAPFDRIPAHVVDGSGLSGGDDLASTPDQTHGTVPDGTMWLSSGNDFGGQDTNPTFTVDLGQVYDVSGIRIFNYNEDSGNPATFTLRGVQTTNVLLSPDGVNFTDSGLGLVTIPKAPGTNEYTGTFFDVLALNGGNPVPFRAIQFDIQSNYGGDNNFYGLSEIQFDGTPAVPEPATAGLIGLLSVVFAGRRRR